MSDKPKPCPFCEWIPEQFGHDIIQGKAQETIIHPYSDEHYCPIGGLVFPVEYWNKRPLEDALRARIEQLEQDTKMLKELRKHFYRVSFV